MIDRYEKYVLLCYLENILNSRIIKYVEKELIDWVNDNYELIDYYNKDLDEFDSLGRSDKREKRKRAPIIIKSLKEHVKSEKGKFNKARASKLQNKLVWLGDLMDFDQYESSLLGFIFRCKFERPFEKLLENINEYLFHRSRLTKNSKLISAFTSISEYKIDKYLKKDSNLEPIRQLI